MGAALAAGRVDRANGRISEFPQRGESDPKSPNRKSQNRQSLQIAGRASERARGDAGCAVGGGQVSEIAYNERDGARRRLPVDPLMAVSATGGRHARKDSPNDEIVQCDLETGKTIRRYRPPRPGGSYGIVWVEQTNTLRVTAVGSERSRNWTRRIISESCGLFRCNTTGSTGWTGTGRCRGCSRATT